jgi:CheY-like chemotaxis protein
MQLWWRESEPVDLAGIVNRVLHIDDEAPIRLLSRVNLEAAGMTVLEAKDGLSGVAKAKRERPDLILLGVMMPGLDGWQVAAALLQDHETRDIPIVFLTARAELRDRARGFGLGAVAYITKPFNPVELAPCVRALLSRLERGERDELRREKMFQLLQDAEASLREHSPADFETTTNAAAECVDAVCFVEEEDWWRVGYDSLASFYAAHEARHPDIRVYAAVRRELPMVSASRPPEGIGQVIAQRLALHSAPPAS